MPCKRLQILRSEANHGKNLILNGPPWIIILMLEREGGEQPADENIVERLIRSF